MLSQKQIKNFIVEDVASAALIGQRKTEVMFVTDINKIYSFNDDISASNLLKAADPLDLTVLKAVNWSDIGGNEVYSHWVSIIGDTDYNTFRGEWKFSDSYLEDDVVFQNDALFRANGPMAASTFPFLEGDAGATWSPIGEVSKFHGPYATTDKFIAGDTVMYNDKLYVANTDIARNGVFAEGIAADEFTLVKDKMSYRGEHSVGNVYKLGDLVKKDSKFYVANGNMLTGIVFVEGSGAAEWTEISKHERDFFREYWLITEEYLQNDLVIKANQIYRANANIAIGTAFAEGTVGATWTKISDMQLPMYRGAWDINTIYVHGDSVTEDDKLYSANSDIPALTAFVEGTNDEEWVEILGTHYRGPWDITEVYAKEDVVTKDDFLWEANDPIAANTAFVEGTLGATWTKISAEATRKFKGIHTTAVNYFMDDAVIVGNDIYKANGDIPILTAFVEGTGASHWTKLSTMAGKYKGDWDLTLSYAKDDVVKYIDGKLYFAGDPIVANTPWATSVFPGGSDWYELSSGRHAYRGAHVVSDTYLENEIVYVDNKFYQANNDITGGTIFTEGTLPDRWTLIGGERNIYRGEFDSAMIYILGDVVSRNRKLFKNTTQTTAGSPWDITEWAPLLNGTAFLEPVYTTATNTTAQEGFLYVMEPAFDANITMPLASAHIVGDCVGFYHYGDEKSIVVEMSGADRIPGDDRTPGKREFYSNTGLIFEIVDINGNNAWIPIESINDKFTHKSYIDDDDIMHIFGTTVQLDESIILESLDLSSIGNYLKTERDSGEKRILISIPLNPDNSSGEPDIPIMGAQVVDSVFYGDDSTDTLTPANTTFEYQITAAGSIYTSSVKLKVGATIPTAPLHAIGYKGSVAAGNKYFEVTWVPTPGLVDGDLIEFPINAEYIDGTTYIFRFTSAADFSLRTNPAGTQPYRTATYNPLSFSMLPYGDKWIDGTAYAVGDEVIEAGKYYYCITPGIQNASFIGNIDRWITSGDYAKLWGAFVDKGVWDASTGVFPTTDLKGSAYRVSVAGTVNAVDFSVGEMIIALKDTPLTNMYTGEWFKLGGGGSSILKGDFSGTEAYNTGEIVIESNQFYRANSNIVANPTLVEGTGAGKWTELAANKMVHATKTLVGEFPDIVDIKAHATANSINDSYIYVTGTDIDTDDVTRLFYVNGSGNVVLIQEEGTHKVFLSATALTTAGVADATHPTTAEMTTLVTNNVKEMRDSFIYITGTDTDTDTTTQIWYVTFDGKLIDISLGSVKRMFLPATTLNAAITEAPTDAEVNLYITTNSDDFIDVRGGVVYYSGTDLPVDEATHVYHIDSTGAVTAINSNMDKFHITTTALTAYAPLMTPHVPLDSEITMFCLHSAKIKNTMVFYTATDLATDPELYIWWVDNSHNVIRLKAGMYVNMFFSATGLGAADTVNPTLAEVAALAPYMKNTILFYNGTDVDSEDYTHIWKIDEAGTPKALKDFTRDHFRGPWVLENKYRTGQIVESGNMLYKANSDIAASTAFVEGSGANEWVALSAASKTWHDVLAAVDMVHLGYYYYNDPTAMKVLTFESNGNEDKEAFIDLSNTAQANELILVSTGGNIKVNGGSPSVGASPVTMLLPGGGVYRIYSTTDGVFTIECISGAPFVTENDTANPILFPVGNKVQIRNESAVPATYTVSTDETWYADGAEFEVQDKLNTTGSTTVVLTLIGTGALQINAVVQSDIDFDGGRNTFLVKKDSTDIWNVYWVGGEI